MDFNIVKRDPYAFECKLTNPDNIEFDAKAHLRLPKIIGEKELYLQFMKRQHHGVCEVDLFVPTSDGNVVSVRNLLFGISDSEDTEKEEIPLIKQYKLFKNSKKFSLCQEEIVVVSYVKDPFNICVQLQQNLGVLEKMKQDMNIFYEHRRAISCVPVKNTDVVIKYEHEFHGNWHRGKILSVNTANHSVDVYFVDWGGSATVSWSNIRLLTEDFTKVECQGITVKLADVQQENPDEPWSQNAIEFLNEQVSTEYTFKMLVTNLEPLEVALFQVLPTVDICINSLLVDGKFATSTGTISETVYWPNEHDAEAENESDDQMHFQRIKKCEEILLESDDSELRDGFRQQVNVIQCESPDLILIKFAKYKESEEAMDKDLQIHYSARRKNKDKWKPSEFCVIYDSTRSKYYRGIIKSKEISGTYQVYLYDQVREVKVPQQLIFVQDPYFKRYLCSVCKCRLANIKPAGDRGQWSKQAIEILQKIFSTHKIIHIKKIETNKHDKIFGVIMWYSLVTPAKALEPSKLNFISINKALIELGVAFSTTSAVNLSYIDNNASAPKNEYEDELQEISNTIQDDLKDNNISRCSKDWYEMICEDEELLTSPLTNWPKPLRLQKTEFDAVLTCIDSEGYFSIRDEDMQALYIELESNLNSKFSSLQLPLEEVEWHPSEMCTILYENSWYRGTVLEILDTQEISVEMIDFGSEHKVKKSELYKHIMFPDMPPLVNKIQLYDVYSKYGSWSADDVEELLQIVTDNIKVVIIGNLDCDTPLAEVYLENGLSVNDLVTQKCSHIFRYKNRVVLRNVNDECESNEIIKIKNNCQEEDNASIGSKDTKSSDNMNSNTYIYAPIPTTNRKIKMFVVNVLKWGSEYNVVLNILNNEVNVDTEEYVALSDDIQEHIEEQPIMTEIEVNEPCVCFHPQNKMWCRAIVYNKDNLNFGYILVFFVDYGTTDMVTINNLRVMRPEWFNLPVYNRVAIINVELVNSSTAEHVLMQMNNLRGKSATVEIVSEDPLKVHLYDGKHLCYQNFINCGILKAL